MIIPDYNSLNSSTSQERYIKSHFPDFYSMLCERYSDITFAEKLYWYFNNITSTPTCPICGGRLPFLNSKQGYRQYCSSKCQGKSPETLAKRKQTNLKKFGTTNPMKSQAIKDKMIENNLKKYGVRNSYQREDVKEKIKQTCLERYGFDHHMKSEEVREKSKHTLYQRYDVQHNSQIPLVIESKRSHISEMVEKIKGTCLERYGEDSYYKTSEFKDKKKQTCVEKYGVPNYNNPDKKAGTSIVRYGVPYYNNPDKKTETCLERYGVPNYNNPKRISETKLINHTFNTSTIEMQFKAYLDSKGVRYNCQYINELYPFSCDFYLPEQDLYIEIQGSWTHGGHPFGECIEDYDTVELWKSKNTKYYDNAIQTWTVRDVKKRETAKANNLNYLEIFSINIKECIELYERRVNLQSES